MGTLTTDAELNRASWRLAEVSGCITAVGGGLGPCGVRVSRSNLLLLPRADGRLSLKSPTGGMPAASAFSANLMWLASSLGLQPGEANQGCAVQHLVGSCQKPQVSQAGPPHLVNRPMATVLHYITLRPLFPLSKSTITQNVHDFCHSPKWANGGHLWCMGHQN